MDKAAVTPGAVTPAREMLAELLMIGHQPKESLVEYQAVLKIAPNRFNALYGAEGSGHAWGRHACAGDFGGAADDRASTQGVAG